VALLSCNEAKRDEGGMNKNDEKKARRCLEVWGKVGASGVGTREGKKGRKKTK
jgi:hypothetical protein